MVQEQLIVTVPPGRQGILQGRSVTAAHLAYRLDAGLKLMRANCPCPLRGGLMAVELGSCDGVGQSESFCWEVVRECLSHGFSGVLLDFDRRTPYLERLAAQLDELLLRRGLRLYVPESYGICASHAGVMISSALSGGTLRKRIEEVQERFGRDRVALALERSAEDFFLPAPTGCGDPLSQQELEALMNRLHPCVFFSDALCARYFTYLTREDGAHFVLFDDGDTLRRKLEVGREAGLHTFLLSHTDLPDCLPIDAGRPRV